MKRKPVVSLITMLACAAGGAWFGHGVLHRDADAAMPQATLVESGETPDDSVLDSPSKPAADPTSSNDQTAETLLKECNRGEALAWLQDSTTPRGVARWTRDEALGLIRDFYATGATKVYVVDTDIVEHTEVASQFVIVLPTDPAIRKAIFSCEARFQAQYDDDPTPDTGQRYLEICTD